MASQRRLPDKQLKLWVGHSWFWPVLERLNPVLVPSLTCWRSSSCHNFHNRFQFFFYHCLLWSLNLQNRNRGPTSKCGAWKERVEWGRTMAFGTQSHASTWSSLLKAIGRRRPPCYLDYLGPRVVSWISYTLLLITTYEWVHIMLVFLNVNVPHFSYPFFSCFQVLVIMNNAVMNIVEQVFLWYYCTYFGYMPKFGIAGSWVRLIPNFQSG